MAGLSALQTFTHPKMLQCVRMAGLVKPRRSMPSGGEGPFRAGCTTGEERVEIGTSLRHAPWPAIEGNCRRRTRKRMPLDDEAHGIDDFNTVSTTLPEGAMLSDFGSLEDRSAGCYALLNPLGCPVWG